MDNDCNITQLAEHITHLAQNLVRDLRRLNRVMRRCPECQGYYCPILLEANPGIERAIQAIEDAHSQFNIEL